MEPNNAQPRLAEYVRPLLARKWLIVLAVILATGGVYAYSAHKANVYTTSTLVFVKDPGDPVTGQQSPQSTDRNVQNEASLLYSRDTAGQVAKKIGYRGSAQDLLSHVSLTSKPGQDFVQVGATGGTPQQAALVANSFAGQLVSLINGSIQLRIQNAIALSKDQLAKLSPGPGSLTQRAQLSDQLNRLQLALQVPTTTARQIDTALPPRAPTSPKPTRDALFAFALSLVFAIGAAYGIERFDRRLKDPDEMDSAYGKPLLAVLPHTDHPSPIKDDKVVFGKEFREPFRVLRTNIDLESLDSPPRTIVVSSAMPGEGKSTVTRNLALAYRESGKSVAVVDLDLRHPALPPLFGVSAAGPGITDVLRHELELGDVIHNIEVGVTTPKELLELASTAARSSNGSKGSTASNGSNGRTAADAGLSVILAGARPANPPAVLASERLTEVLDELRDRHDIVLIDSAPILAVTDTVPLLRYADASLFVGRLGVTTRDTARRLVDFLARVPDLNLLGVVANDLSKLEAGSYGYGYGYGYGPYSEDPPVAIPQDEAASKPRRLRRQKQKV
jgi:Mrp family chromosome partitioning ATPase/capsular polysaccharide biosynthesis protein